MCVLDTPRILSCNPSIREQEVKDQKVKVILSYVGSLKLVLAT